MTVVGLGITLFALMGIPAVFLGGYVSDRFGRRRALMASMLASAAVYGLYPWISGAPTYLLLSALAGVSLSIYWPASNAMLTDLTPPEERGRVFGWLNVVNNAALGAGALLGSVTVDSLAGVFDDPARRYHILYYVDAGTYLAFLAILWLWIDETLPSRAAGEYAGFRKGWGEALRDGNLLFLGALMVCFTLIYSAYFVLPVFFHRFLGLTEGQAGWPLVLNMAMVVLLQMPLWSVLDPWRRTRSLALAAAFFALGLSGFLACGTGLAAGVAGALAAMAVFTLGELAHGPAAIALFGSLAPEHLRGTYMSVNSMTWSLGLGLGPVVMGCFLDAGRPGALWLLMIAVMAAAAAGLAVFERRVPREVNRPGA